MRKKLIKLCMTLRRKGSAVDEDRLSEKNTAARF